MAVLQKIRNKGVLLVTCIAVALFLFVIGDALRGGEVLVAQSKQQVGEVNGKEVSIQEYQKMIEELQTYYEVMTQKSSFTEDELNRIKDEAWQTFVQNTLIKTECDKLGLAVTDEEIAEIIQTGASQMLQTPFFMNEQTGTYDFSVLQGFLSEYKKMKDTGNQVPDIYEKIYNYYIFVQKAIRNQLLMSKYQTLTANSFLSNPIEAKSSFEGRNNESEIVLASVPFSSVPEKEIIVTDEEIKEKYNENKEKYRMYFDTRDVKYISVKVTPSNEDKDAAEKDINNIYQNLNSANEVTSLTNVVRTNLSLIPYNNIFKSKEAFPLMISSMLDSVSVGETFKPKYDAMTNTYYTFKLVDKKMQADSVLFRQMAVIGNDANDIKVKADSILNALKSGSDFKSIAKKFNQTGDSAWIASAHFQNGTLDADNSLFITSIYETNVGENKKIELSNGNTIILQVLEKKNIVEKYNVASVVKELKFSDETYTKEYNKFSSFVAANTTAETIEENAEKAGYRVLTLNDVANSNHNIANIANTRDAIKWAFDEAEEGSISPLYECGHNDNMLIVILKKVNKSGYRDIEKVRDILTNEIKNEKKAEKILADLSNVKSIEDAKKVSNVKIDTVSHISFAIPTFVSATNSSEPIIGALAAKTDAGKFVGPTKGNNGVYMFKVLSKTKTAEKYDEKTEESTLSNTAMRNATNNIINDLYLKANIKDNRYKFF